MSTVSLGFKFITFLWVSVCLRDPACTVGSGMGNSGRGHGGGPQAQHGGGIETIDNVHFDMSNKFLQRITAGGTSYTPYTSPNGHAVFRRRVVDTNRHFVVFPDASYPPGSGHFIVLRKMLGRGFQGAGREEVYEAFNMYIEESARAMILNWPHDGPASKHHADANSKDPASLENEDGNQRPENHAGHHADKHVGILDVGEVVTRKKRKNQNIFNPPNFSNIEMSLLAAPPLSASLEEEQEVRGLSSNIKPDGFSSENFDGFSIEPEE